MFSHYKFPVGSDHMYKTERFSNNLLTTHIEAQIRTNISRRNIKIKDLGFNVVTSDTFSIQ